MKNKIKNLLLRLLNAVIWVPVIVTGVLVVTGEHHLLGRILLLFFSAVSGWEVGGIFKKNEPSLVRWPFFAYGSIIPFFTILFQEFPRNMSFYILLIVLLILLIFAVEAFLYSTGSTTGVVLSRISARLFCLVYPGLFFAFMIMLPTLNHAVVVFTMFFFVTMLNDTMAYFVGLLFGKSSKTQGIIAVSPKKSLVGFIGGVSASIGTVLIYYYFLHPEVFVNTNVWYAILMGLACGIAAIIGDLFESLLKRSVDMKDSGNFFMGRGGVLDSFDSLMFVAPVYYYFVLYIQ